LRPKKQGSTFKKVPFFSLESISANCLWQVTGRLDYSVIYDTISIKCLSELSKVEKHKEGEQDIDYKERWSVNGDLTLILKRIVQ